MATRLPRSWDRWRNALEKCACLLVIDDVWQTEALEELLKGGSRCGRLITTRNEFAGQQVINIDKMKMSDEVALRLLFHRNVTVNDADPCALEIIQTLGHLPLAIDLVGRCMDMDGLTPAKFLKCY